MTVATELSEIQALRLSPAYQAAELIRQQIGAAAMAAYPPASVQYGGLRLMIGTWETIAIKVRGNDALKEPFYQNNPVGYMWNKLSPGIKAIRKVSKIKAVKALYGNQFSLLNTAYGRWLKDQPADYRSAALSGISAQFG